MVVSEFMESLCSSPSNRVGFYGRSQRTFMNLAYSLNQHLPVEKVMNDIVKMCQKISQDDLGNMVLVISISKRINYDGDSLLPKLEYKK